MFEYEGIQLRKLSREDLPRLLELKEESWFGTHRVAILNLDDQERWFQTLGGDNLVFVASAGSEKVGIFKVLQIDWHNRIARVGWDIFAPFRGQELGKRLVAAGTALCFELLNLRRLDAEILETNVASRRCAELVGYVLEGCRRQAVARQCHTTDSLLLGILVDDYVRRRPRTNYVLATWSGSRRHAAPSPIHFLEQHLQALGRTPHELTQITVVAPHDPAEPETFTRFLACLPPKIRGARLTLLRRPNIGMSYGSYAHAYSVYRRAFDFYIFMEDDYQFTQPDFDRLLRERFLLEKDCGYLAGLVVGHGDDRHGAISNGITSSAVLEEIWQQYAEIPHARQAGQYDNSHQLEFTRAFQIGGRRLCDLTDQFQIRFSNLGSVQSFGQPQLPLLMQPIPHELTSAPATILILLLYHERPVMVRNALRSIRRANAKYPHWQLAFIDDGSLHAGEPIVREILGDCLEQVRFYRNAPRPPGEDSTVGQAMNQAILESSAEIAIMLCDDDELHPEYLANLARFFAEHPTEMSCYSYVHLYNPAWEDSRYVDNLGGPYNRWQGRIHPSERVDASQVAWRTRVNKELGAWFEYPLTACLDRSFYRQLTEVAGETPFSGFVAQYKGIHSAQLTSHLAQPLGLQIDTPHVRAQTPLDEVLRLIERYARRGQSEALEQILDRATEVFPAQQPHLRRLAAEAIAGATATAAARNR